MIRAVHMDDRLIHGQVAISWTRTLGVNVLLVVNDEIVHDQLRKNALKLGVPAGVKYGFRSVKDGIDFLNGDAVKKYNIMVLINNPQDAEALCKGVKGITRLTIGGIRKDAPYIADNLNLTAEDVKSLEQIMDLGIEVGMQPTPADKFTILKTILKK